MWTGLGRAPDPTINPDEMENERNRNYRTLEGQIDYFPNQIDRYVIQAADFGTFQTGSGLQIYGGPGSLSHDFKIWPITFQGSGPILFSCEKISL